MNNIKLLSSIILLLLCTQCSVLSKQNMGKVSPEKFRYKTNFSTLKTLIVLPVKINGVEKNFLFDTGAEVNIIQRDSILGESTTLVGASGNSKTSGSEIVSSLKIENINFENTFAINTNMQGIKEQIPNFGGLLGQSVISKANWLINYPQKSIEVSSQNLSDKHFNTLKTNIKNGRHYTQIDIDGRKEKVLLDFGSSRKLIVSKNSKLASFLLENYEFKDKSRTKSNTDKSEIVLEKVANIPLVKLDLLEFKNVEVTLGKSKNTRIGISFFEDYQIYIDNDNNKYQIKI